MLAFVIKTLVIDLNGCKLLNTPEWKRHLGNVDFKWKSFKPMFRVKSVISDETVVC